MAFPKIVGYLHFCFCLFRFSEFFIKFELIAFAVWIMFLLPFGNGFYTSQQQ